MPLRSVAVKAGTSMTGRNPGVDLHAETHVCTAFATSVAAASVLLPITWSSAASVRVSSSIIIDRCFTMVPGAHFTLGHSSALRIAFEIISDATGRGGLEREREMPSHTSHHPTVHHGFHGVGLSTQKILQLAPTGIILLNIIFLITSCAVLGVFEKNPTAGQVNAKLPVFIREINGGNRFLKYERLHAGCALMIVYFVINLVILTLLSMLNANQVVVGIQALATIFWVPLMLSAAGCLAQYSS
jgi:hypothetical protein